MEDLNGDGYFDDVVLRDGGGNVEYVNGFTVGKIGGTRHTPTQRIES
jgi:hypothetical protein